MHLSAARWFESQRDFRSALAEACAAGDPAEIARLLSAPRPDAPGRRPDRERPAGGGRAGAFPPRRAPRPGDRRGVRLERRLGQSARLLRPCSGRPRAAPAGTCVEAGHGALGPRRGRRGARRVCARGDLTAADPEHVAFLLAWSALGHWNRVGDRQGEPTGGGSPRGRAEGRQRAGPRRRAHGLDARRTRSRRAPLRGALRAGARGGGSRGRRAANDPHQAQPRRAGRSGGRSCRVRRRTSAGGARRSRALRSGRADGSWRECHGARAVRRGNRRFRARRARSSSDAGRGGSRAFSGTLATRTSSGATRQAPARGSNEGSELAEQSQTCPGVVAIAASDSPGCWQSPTLHARERSSSVGSHCTASSGTAGTLAGRRRLGLRSLRVDRSAPGSTRREAAAPQAASMSGSSPSRSSCRRSRRHDPAEATAVSGGSSTPLGAGRAPAG